MKKIFQFGIIIEILGLLSTFSRSAIFGFALGAFIFMLLLWQNKKPRIAVFILSLLVPTLLFSVFSNDIWSTRFFGTDRLETRSLQEHVASYQTGLSVIKNHWLLGVGVGNYTYAVYKDMDSHLPSFAYQPVH